MWAVPLSHGTVARDRKTRQGESQAKEGDEEMIWDRKLFRSPDKVGWCSGPFAIHADREEGPCVLMSEGPYWIGPEHFQTVSDAKKRAEEVAAKDLSVHVKPCPFCGAPPRLAEISGRVSVQCQTVNCPASRTSSGGAILDSIEVLRRWNTREPA